MGREGKVLESRVRFCGLLVKTRLNDVLGCISYGFKILTDFIERFFQNVKTKAEIYIFWTSKKKYFPKKLYRA